MARCKLSPQEFIQNTFSPMIAVITSSSVENVCRKNNLTFLQMLRPFCKLSTEGTIKDPSGVSVPVKNLRVSLCDVNWRPPQPADARIFFNESVSSYINERTTAVYVGTTKIEIPVSVPWYEAWRHTFLQVQFPSDHEFTKHYVGCILVVSTSDESPLECLAELVEKLQGLMSEAPNKLPKWFSPSPYILNAYLLLHDNTIGESVIKGEATFEAMKTTYGTNRCFYLSVNSSRPSVGDTQLPDPWAQFISPNYHYDEKSKEGDTSIGVETAQEAAEKNAIPTSQTILHPLSPLNDDYNFATPNGHSFFVDPDRTRHGQYLSAEDINKIRLFINDFCTKVLLPHFEQQIQILSDQVSNRKGVSRSLFSATKRWFGTSKPGTPGNNIPPTAIAYSMDSHELQLRRLGDLCFMIGHYSLAFTAYHSAKRDFMADGAWLHYAGALEMAALSAFMANSEAFPKKFMHYAEESITTYLNSCNMQQFATRATILSVECLKGKGMYGEAANQLIRMTREDSDLRSAVLLEQAAYCFLHSNRPTMHRKYAFHMVMAGHRYFKAGHKNHSIRCYTQAYQVYEGKMWSVAEDHINFTVGKESAQLKLTANAVEAFSRLVTRSSRQPAQQQMTFIKEYITAIQQLDADGISEPLVIPVIHFGSIQVLLAPPLKDLSSSFRPASGINFDHSQLPKANDESRWVKMEEKLVSVLPGMNTMVFKPHVELLTSKTDNSTSPVVIVGEVVSISIEVKNPLHVPLKLSDVKLLWSTTPGKCTLKNSTDEGAVTEIINEIVVLEDSTKHIVLTLTPTTVGELYVIGLFYKLVEPSSGSQVAGWQPLVAQSPKKGLKEDKRLQFSVIEKAPFLNVSFSGLKDSLMCGEIMPVTVKLRSQGQMPISRILLATSRNFTLWVDGQTKISNESDPYPMVQIPLRGVLRTNESEQITIYIRAPLETCDTHLDFLFCYEGSEKSSKFRYRLVRHCNPTTIYNYVCVSALCTRSNTTSQPNEGVNIRLKISNKIKGNEPFTFKLYLDSVSLNSYHWRLGKKIFAPDSLEILAQENLLVMVQAFWEVLTSENLFSTVKFNPAASNGPYRHFVPELPALVNSEISAICIVNWAGEITYQGMKPCQIIGQEHVNITCINRSLPKVCGSPEAARLKLITQVRNELPSIMNALLTFRIHHPAEIKFTLANERLCVTPVELFLQNGTNRKINLKIQAVTTPSDTSDDDALVSVFFAWMGQTVFTRDMDAFSSITVSLLAAFTAPGAYDLSSRLVILARVDEEFIPQTCKPEAVIIVS